MTVSISRIAYLPSAPAPPRDASGPCVHRVSLHHSFVRAVLLVASLCLLAVDSCLADPTVLELMNKAERAYVAHDYDTATELFIEVLQVDPQNTHAIAFLRKIRLSEAGMPSPGKDSIEGLVIPKIEFKDATFSAALDFLKQQAALQSVTVSFVPQLPAPQMDHRVTLSLSNVPFLDALRYLCELNGAVFKVERYAIVISPRPIGATPASQ